MHKSWSWGRQPQKKQKELIVVRDLIETQIKDYSKSEEVLPYGQGRSYGDSCLNTQGVLLSSEQINHFISFDKEQGIIESYAGVTLEDLLELIVPEGWFLPVSPGTKYISLGGAVANDIHGKNHHIEGTFGNHVLEINLVRSNGEKIKCSKEQNSDLYSATIGGLGLTGFILSIKIKLKKISSAFIDVETFKFKGFSEFMHLTQQSDSNYEYTVSWFDCMVDNAEEIKGLFMRGNHSQEGKLCSKNKKLANIPIIPKFSFVNKLSMKLFNNLYYLKQISKFNKSRLHYDLFFYPLDLVPNWNLLYGQSGFVQLQFVIPIETAHKTIDKVILLIKKYQTGSSISVLKAFGEMKSPGLLSFPRKGITIAMDFPYKSDTKEMMHKIYDLILEQQGAIYPAKDMLMSSDHFTKSFDNIDIFKNFIDPRFNSDLWQRVNKKI